MMLSAPRGVTRMAGAKAQAAKFAISPRITTEYRVGGSARTYELTLCQGSKNHKLKLPIKGSTLMIFNKPNWFKNAETYCRSIKILHLID